MQTSHFVKASTFAGMGLQLEYEEFIGELGTDTFFVSLHDDRYVVTEVKPIADVMWRYEWDDGAFKRYLFEGGRWETSGYWMIHAEGQRNWWIHEGRSGIYA